MKKDHIDVELRSESLNEVLSTPPSWITRSGNVFLVVILIFSILLAWLISYPDEIAGHGTISRSAPPVEIFNLTTVQLRWVPVSENQLVKENTILAIFEDQVAPRDVYTLLKYLELLNTSSKLPELPPHSDQFKLGSFTPIWLKYLSVETHSRLENAILTDQFTKWKLHALLLAPCSGKLLFHEQLQLHKLYSPYELSVIIDQGKGLYTANCEIDVNGSSTVRKGQKVLIELADYKPDEFGVLNGKVKAVYQIQNNGKYNVEIELPEQLKTSYKKEIPQKALLVARIRIITKQKSFLNRIFENIF